MKKTLLFFYAFLLALPTFAQTEVCFEDEDLHSDFYIIGDELYISYEDHVAKVNLTDPNKNVTRLIDVGRPTGMLAHKGEIYVLEGASPYRIFKFKMGLENPQRILVNEGSFNHPADLIVIDNKLYISDFNGNKISYIDLNDQLPAQTVDVIPEIKGPNGLFLIGDDLYVCQSFDDKIVKFNINNPKNIEDVITQGLDWPHSLELIGEELFVSNTFSNNILKFNVKDGSLALEEVQTLSKPTMTLRYNGQLYSMLRDDDKIVKYGQYEWTSSQQLDMEEEQLAEVFLYPNPAVNDLFFQHNLNQLKGTINNSQGVEVMEFNIGSGNMLDVSNLSAGVYFINLRDKHVLKFVKN